MFDKRDQYDQVVSGLLEGERVIAVYDAIGAGTGFIGVTDLRQRRAVDLDHRHR